MSDFTVASGTRGGRQSGGFAMSWFNTRMAREYEERTDRVIPVTQLTPTT